MNLVRGKCKTCGYDMPDLDFPDDQTPTDLQKYLMKYCCSSCLEIGKLTNPPPPEPPEPEEPPYIPSKEQVYGYG